LTRESPFALRLWAYLQERFPPLGYGVLIVSYYSSNQFLAKTLTDPNKPMHYNLGSLLGAIALLCVFFHLRVCDEHKDFEDDSRHYPERILQRGLVTLANLRWLGLAAVVVEWLCAALWRPQGQPAALVGVVVVQVFSFLMLKEFFIAGWLRRHFLAYAVTHMLVMPFISLMVFSFATGRYPWEAPGWYWLYAWVGFFVTFNWEISRKIRAPEQEIEGVDSYTKVFGTYGAAWMVLLVRVIDTGMVALVGWHLGLSVWFYVVLVALYAVCLTGFVHYRLRTNAKTAKRMETYAGMYIIAFDLTLAVELGRKFGVTWG
ncbi:MAG: UbiA family prenyltransferase, partial [Planctomycetia bacterium]|nr:UbiA family prenyltransferase [Planctomycetia bacterium]